MGAAAGTARAGLEEAGAAAEAARAGLEGAARGERR